MPREAVLHLADATDEPSATDLELLGDGALGVAEAAEFAGIGRSNLYRAMEDGELRFVKRGRRRLIPRRALVRFLAKGLNNT